MVIINSVITRSKAPRRYFTQSGVVVTWVGGGGTGSGGSGAGGGSTGGIVCGVGTGTITGGDAGGGVTKVGGDSVLKVLVALQAL